MDSLRRHVQSCARCDESPSGLCDEGKALVKEFRGCCLDFTRRVQLYVAVAKLRHVEHIHELCSQCSIIEDCTCHDPVLMQECCPIVLPGVL
jgi:hypothetical protein